MSLENTPDVQSRGALSSAQLTNEVSMQNVAGYADEIKPEKQQIRADGCVPVAETVGEEVAAVAASSSAVSNDVADVADETVSADGSEQPCPKEDGAEILDEITEALRSHVIMPVAEAQMCSLWIMHALTIDAHQHSPRLAVMSPIPNCGKTTLCSAMGLLTGTEVLSNITTAGFFRLVDQQGGQVIILDELDTFLTGENKAAVGILNSGHSREGAHVVRAESTGQGYEPKRFRTWAPVVFGLIGKLPSPALESRSLPILLKRKRRDEKVQPLQETAKEALRLLRLRACRWAFQHVPQLRKADPKIPDCLYNRNQDNWRPLLAVADAAGGPWPKTARAVAEALSGESEDPSEGVMLLADIRRIFEKKKTDRLPTKELLDALNAREDRPWHDFREEGFPIGAKELARLLKVFGIHPSSVRVSGTETPKGYRREWFEDAFDRYLPPDSVEPAPAATNATENDLS